MSPRIFQRWFSMGCLLLGLLTMPPALRADTLFSDDFGPKPLASWTPSPLGLLSHWSSAAGTAAYDGGGHTQLWAGSGAWTDYTLEGKFVLANGSNYPGGLRGRVNLATGTGYAAWLYPADGVVKLFRAAAWNIDAPGVTLLAQASVGTIAPSTIHTLSLTFSGSQISVAFNGTTVIQATDTALVAGAVALDVSNQPIAWDDILVTDGSTTLFSDDFSPRPLRSWTASPLGLAANWDASTGAASYNGGGHTQLWAGSNGWTDYKVETKFRVANAANYPGGLRGRVDTSTGAGYAAWIYPGSGVIKLWRAVAWHVDTPGLTLLQEIPVGTITTGVYHTLALIFEGSLISVVYDGTTVAQVTDTTLTSGAVALDVSNQPIDFDDVAVTTLPAPPPESLLLAADFSSNSLASWTPSPLGLFSNWTAASGSAATRRRPATPTTAGRADPGDQRGGQPVQPLHAEILLGRGAQRIRDRDDRRPSTRPSSPATTSWSWARCRSPPAQVTMLTDWVNAGGNLIAMRPDAQLAGLLGLTPAKRHAGERLPAGRTPQSAPGAGIVDQTMQFHGTADRYTLNGATERRDAVFRRHDGDRATRP